MAVIPRIKLGSQGLEVSKLGLGCMGMSAFYGPPKPDEDMIRLIREAVNMGVTFLDTSDIYGPYTNEILVGKAIKGIREKVQVATKFALVAEENGSMSIRGDPEHVRAACEASLKRLDRMPKFRPENIEHNKVLYERLSKIAAKSCCTPGQLALAWVLNQGNDVAPIPGTTKLNNLKENVSALALHLSQEDMEEIERAVPRDLVAGERYDDAFMSLTWRHASTPPLSAWQCAGK